MERNYYDLLGVAESATVSEIQAAFKNKAKEVHPDTITAENPYLRKIAAEAFKSLSEAKTTLLDDAMRQKYDAKLAYARGSTASNSAPDMSPTAEAPSHPTSTPTPEKSQTYSSWKPSLTKSGLVVVTVLALLVATYFADKATRVKPHASGIVSADVGKPAPDLSLKDLNDKDVSLTGLKGKVILVNFWATWCDPCRIEIPWLIEMQSKYGNKGLVILGIAMDDEGKSVVAPFVTKERFDVNGQKLPMSYPILIGNDDAANKFGGILGYPTSYLISRDGKIVKKVQGLVSYEEISKAIESQL